MKKLLGLFLCLGLVGCATLPVPQQKSEKYTANFSYSPVAQGVSSRNEVTFAVANAVYKQSPGEVFWFASSQFVNFSPAVRQDLSKIIIAKGFGVRGPYESYDLIPFQDKKAIDLLLVPAFELSVVLKEQKEQLENYWGWQSPTIQTGIADVSGQLNIELRDIATRELIWTKTIPIDQFEFSYIVSIPWGRPYVPGKLYNYDSVLDGMAKGMGQKYPEIMAKVYNLIDVEEMGILKKQAQELKSKKGY